MILTEETLVQQFAEYLERSLTKKTIAEIIHEINQTIGKSSMFAVFEYEQLAPLVKKAIDTRDALKYKSTCIFTALMWYMIATHYRQSAELVIGWPKNHRKGRRIAHCWTNIRGLRVSDETGWSIIVRYSNEGY